MDRFALEFKEKFLDAYINAYAERTIQFFGDFMSLECGGVVLFLVLEGTLFSGCCRGLFFAVVILAFRARVVPDILFYLRNGFACRCRFNGREIYGTVGNVFDTSRHFRFLHIIG